MIATQAPVGTARPRRQRGAAVLIAMLVVAMATMVASGLLFQSHVEWRRLGTLLDQDQSRWILRAAEQWGAVVLWDDARHSRVDHPGEAWATQLPPVEAEGYRVSGRIEDQDGRFNLNNLVVNGQVDRRQLEIFTRLLRNLALPETLAPRLADWIDADEIRPGQGSAESEYHAGLKPPYQAANRPLVTLNELLRVKGFNRGVLATLAPFVTLLPTPTALNVNTARAEVLAALVEGMSMTEAHALVAKRERTYFRTVQDFKQALPEKLPVQDDAMSVASAYFLVHLRASHNRLSIGERALLFRPGTTPPSVIWRAEL